MQNMKGITDDITPCHFAIPRAPSPDASLLFFFFFRADCRRRFFLPAFRHVCHWRGLRAATMPPRPGGRS